ncbi:MAG TPA: pyrrolo-quinoline quinone [Terriglobales bacterium]
MTILAALAVVGFSIYAISCGGGSSAVTPQPGPTPASFTITPSSSSIIITQTQQFIASAGNNVNWSVNGTAGGNTSVGTISSSGLYTAPAKVPESAKITVGATSAADSSSSASTDATIVPYQGVLTYHNDNGRTGQKLDEQKLTASNVNSGAFGKLFSVALDGQVYAQPLYVSHVAIANQGFHNTLYVATEHDSVYAFDADGNTTKPLWSVNFTNAGQGVTTVAYTKESGVSPIYPEVGITSTPVIDGNTGTIYVVAVTEENGTVVHRLHALDITNGSEKFGGPIVIQASVAGTGAGSNGGQVAFQPEIQLQRSALLLSKGAVYIAWASYNDIGAYHGWVMGYDAGTLKQTAIWNDTPNGTDGGIWLAGCGLSADSNGDIYVVTGNGTYDASSSGKDYGDSFVKLTLNNGSLSVSDYFTPFNQSSLSTDDIDLGSSGFVLLPDQPGAITHLGISAGKEGRIYLLDRDNLGKFHSGDDSQIVQSMPNALGTTANGRNLSTAIYWQGNIYYAGHADAMKQFPIVNGMFATTPSSTSAHSFGYTAASSLSANGSSDGILWTVDPSASTLFAYDATNLSNVLFSTGLTDAVRFVPPTIANGHVYVAGATQLSAFGPLQ